MFSRASTYIFLAALVGSAVADFVFDNPEWKAGVKWQIEILEPVDITQALVPKNATVWDMDLFHLVKNPGIGKSLKDQGKIIICYFSAGTLHTGANNTKQDPDYSKFDGVTLGIPYHGWDGEVWLDIKNKTVLEIMKSRMDMAKKAGCDGVDPDNLDGYKDIEDEPGKPLNGLNLTEADYSKYLVQLADAAHNNSLLIGQKNAPELTGIASVKCDFAVLEQCFQNGNCSTWQPYIAKNKPVFQIEYPPSVAPKNLDKGPCPSSAASKADYDTYCPKIITNPGNNNTGFSTILKQDGGACGLGNWTTYCDGSNKPIFVPLGVDSD
jgi:hypothetical protein